MNRHGTHGFQKRPSILLIIKIITNKFIYNVKRRNCGLTETNVSGKKRKTNTKSYDERFARKPTRKCRCFPPTVD